MLGDNKMAASLFGRNGSFGEVVPLYRALPTTLRHEHTFEYHAISPTEQERYPFGGI